MGIKTGFPALIITVLFAALFFPHPAAGRTKLSHAKTAGVKKGNAAILPAQECSKCHSDIFRNWKQSRHAAAYENPVFQTAYRKTWLEEGLAAARLCLPCHAPTVTITGDYTAAEVITREGVTCNFCHGVTAVEMPAVPAKGSGYSHGRDKQPASAAAANEMNQNKNHGAYFTEARPCAGCHDFENRHKVPIGTTWSEWRASSSATAGDHCQKCHMPLIAGRTANKDGRDEMHDHSLATTLESMSGAVTAEIADITVSGNAVTASITIRNVKAGHFVPTGSPARSLVLEIRLMNAAGNVLETQKRIYRKTVTDRNGNEITSFDGAFLHAAAVTADNRIGPGESRTETVLFRTSPGENATVAAELYLLTTPAVAQREEMKIPLSTPGIN